jgi:hypothetical protein
MKDGSKCKVMEYYNFIKNVFKIYYTYIRNYSCAKSGKQE